MSLSVVILAAGQGKRMRSDLPKVLHTLAGKTLLEHIVNTAIHLAPTQPPLVIYGHKGEQVKNTLSALPVTWIHQTEQLGTGHAAAQALPHIPDDHRVLILSGDVPLITHDTLQQLLATPDDAIGIITATLENPAGFGRIIRDANQQIINIIEEKDATLQQKQIKEMNAGIYLIKAKHLKHWLPKLSNHNAQQEYYLPEIISFALQEKIPVHSIQPFDYQEILGINDRIQLAELERFVQRKLAEHHMKQGATFLDPARVDIRGELTIGQDTTIDINFISEGRVIIGNHCTIGANVLLRNTVIGDYTEIKANSLIDSSEIARHCVIGPFARIRPGTVLAEKARVGNFVEIKNSFIDCGTKINHLSYIGDSEIGKLVNIGAGTITCNYDGINKHQTVIGDAAFIGSCTQLVAPVSIGEGATIGAGSTITANAPPHKLTLARAKQITIENWKRNNPNELKEK